MKTKAITLFSTVVLAASTGATSAFADEVVPVTDGSSNPVVSAVSTPESSSNVSDGTSSVVLPTGPSTATTTDTATETEVVPVTPVVPVAPVTPTDPTATPSTETPVVPEQPSEPSATIVPTAPSAPVVANNQAPASVPDVNKVVGNSTVAPSQSSPAPTTQTPEPSAPATNTEASAPTVSQKQAVTVNQEAATQASLPQTGDDSFLTVSLSVLGAFLIALGLGFRPKKEQD